MFHHILSEFMGTALMIVFGVGVHCDDVLKRTKYAGSGHMFAITTWAFGISVVLFVFGGVCINPAMALAQAILGMIPWSYFIPYVIAEMLGGICGAVIVILCMLIISSYPPIVSIRSPFVIFFYKSEPTKFTKKLFC